MVEGLANALVFGLLGLDPVSRTGVAVQLFIMDVAKIFVLLVVVIYVMGWLRALVGDRRSISKCAMDIFTIDERSQ